MVALPLMPENSRCTVTIVCEASKVAVPEPVPALPLGGTSEDPRSVAVNEVGEQDGIGVGVGTGVGVGV